MKKLSRALFLMALLIGAAAIQSNLRAQEEPMVGGYGDMSVKSAAAIRAAKFAVSAQARKTGKKIVFVKLVAAEQQVVAGMNFKLTIQVRVNRKLKTVTGVVFRNLHNRQSLTSWEN